MENNYKNYDSNLYGNVGLNDEMIQATNNMDGKKEYIVRHLSRTRNKKYENYVITRIWHKLNRLDVKLVTQQYVSRPLGYALIDLYFPQIGLFIEVDEGHHLLEANIIKDKIRDKDVVEATDKEIIRIDVTKNVESIHQQIDEIVTQIQHRIEQLGDSFIPQGMDSLGFMRYRFKGVFRLNSEKTIAERSAFWERISEEVNTVNPIASSKKN